MESFQIPTVIILLIVLASGSPALPSSLIRPLSNYPNATYSKAQYFTSYGSERVTIKYGPFTAPSSTENNGMESFRILNITMPCHNCLITYMQAGLTYPNGSYANANTGMWLHHVLLTNRARITSVCTNQYDRFFASGNERSPFEVSVKGTDKSGYWLAKNDTVALLAELMNETEDARDAVVTITYEYIPYLPPSFAKSTPIWLDITGCGTSEEEVPMDAVFSFTSPTWISNLTGRVTFVGSHLHDGGIDLKVSRNNKTICDGVASYGETSGYVESMASGNTTMAMNSAYGMDMEHISSITVCYEKGWVRKGDELAITANYNLSAHAPMVDADGMPAPVMGISVLYAAQSLE